MEEKLTKDILLEMGFKDVVTFTVTGAMTFQLGRDRHLSIGSHGTPNETLFICEQEGGHQISDLICLYNYDYDGYLTRAKLQCLIDSIGKTINT